MIGSVTKLHGTRAEKLSEYSCHLLKSFQKSFGFAFVKKMEDFS